MLLSSKACAFVQHSAFSVSSSLSAKGGVTPAQAGVHLLLKSQPSTINPLLATFSTSAHAVFLILILAPRFLLGVLFIVGRTVPAIYFD